jgi:membrane protein required for colicin V production
VPQIDTPLLLDILLGLVVLLFVPFGIRRGVAKEAMVSAGLLLGAILAGRFSESWGTELAARFAMDPGVARFAVSASMLLAGVFLLGYGAGAALGVMRAGTLSRLVGGLLAAFNAALLLSYLLRWIDEFLAGGAALDDGIISEALLRRSDSLLLGAAGVLLALTILGWIVNAARAHRQPRNVDDVALAGIPARQRPVRVAPAADAGKYEPGGGPVARSGRFGAGIDATTPLPAGTSLASQGRWSAEGQTMVATNGHGSGGQLDAARQRATDAPQPQLDDTVWSAWSTEGSEEPYARAEPATQWPVAPSLGVTDDERCAVCHARVGTRDVFCPECGATL